MQVYAGFLSALNDPYTVYYNEEETKEIKESTSGEYSGIGAAMMQNVQTGRSRLQRSMKTVRQKRQGF